MDREPAILLDEAAQANVSRICEPLRPKSDVAAAYQAARGLFKLPRQPQEGPYLVVQFVEAARTADPSLTWGELYKRFKRKYPDRYGSMASFRETYYAKRPRQQGK